MHSQAEIGEKEQKLETLKSKVSELKTCSQSQEAPAKLQVLNIIYVIYVYCELYMLSLSHNM